MPGAGISLRGLRMSSAVATLGAPRGIERLRARRVVEARGLDRPWLPRERKAFNMFIRLLSAAASAAATMAAAAFPDGAEAQSRELMVVTATRTLTPAEALPVRVDVLTRAEIELDNIQTLADAAARATGVYIEQSGPAGSVSSGFFRGTNSSHALALFDGVRLNDPSAPNGRFDFGRDTLADAERVEIVRGPLSAVYGSDAIGGVVNVIPRIGGEDAFSPYFETSYGTFETVRALAGATGSVERLRYGLTFDHFQTNGFDVVPERMSTRTGDPDGARISTLTAIGDLSLGRGFSLEGLLRIRDAENEYDTFSGGPSGFQRGDDPDVETVQDDTTLWRAGLAYAAGELESRLRVGQILTTRENVDAGAMTDAYDGERTFADWLSTWRPQSAAGAPEISFGVQYERDAIETTTAFASPVDEDEDRFGVYLGAGAQIGDRLCVRGSVRHDDYEAADAETTYSLGTVFDIPEIATQLTASYGTAYRAPSLNERFETSAFNIGNPDLRAESSESWEAGFRTALSAFGQAEGVSFGAVYYQTDIEDLIEYDFVAFQNINIGRAEIDGAEAWLELQPVEHFELRLAYAYTDAQNAATRAQLLRRPEHMASLTARYAFTERLRASFVWSHVGERTDVNYDDDGFFLGSGGVIDGHDVVSVSGEYGVSDAIALFASVNNLLDQTYERPEAFAAPGRAVTLGLRGRF